VIFQIIALETLHIVVKIVFLQRMSSAEMYLLEKDVLFQLNVMEFHLSVLQIH
jgi:hypothetical protein